MRAGLFALAALAAAAAGELNAQAQPARACVVDIDSVGRAANIIQVRGGYHVYAGGGVYARCRHDSTTMVSDSLIWFSDRGELRLLGNVHFRDSTSMLDAERVTYWVRQERLVAEGNVYTRNLRTGSDLRGPHVDYLRAVPSVRDTVEFVATGRPTIRFYSARDSARGEREPFVVVANRVKMKHTDRMWASGRVTIDRSDVSARSDSAMLDLADSTGLLIGVPEVIGRDTAAAPGADTYRLAGQRIRFELTGNQDFKRVVAMGDADATGPDWHLHSDTLDAAIDSGKVQRAQAWGWENRPTAVSGLTAVVGDSLDIVMPGQVMRLVWAFGRARATSRPDSSVSEEDWLAGDTLRAQFAPRDSAGARRTEVERVAAFGGARAYYHLDNRRDPEGPRGVNYSRGTRIQIAMRDRKVRTVDVVGQVDGIYLEPVPARAADTAQADSAAAPGPAAPPGRPAAPREPAPGRPADDAPRPAPAPRLPTRPS